MGTEPGDRVNRASSVYVQYLEEVVGKAFEVEVSYHVGGEEAVLGLGGREPHKGAYLIVNRLVVLLEGLELSLIHI